jgi:hypothetical protein
VHLPEHGRVDGDLNRPADVERRGKRLDFHQVVIEDPERRLGVRAQ